MAVARALVFGALLLSFLQAVSAQFNSPRYLSHAEAAAVFTALGESLPAPADWPRWIRASDAATRARVAEGDELSVVNLLLFGTSFTNQPRVTAPDLAAASARRAVDGRIQDLERALVERPADERLHFVRRVVGGSPVRTRLLAMIDRVIKDAGTHAKRSTAAGSLGDPSLEFAERSRLYRDRGLATDSSVRINFAIERALGEARAERAVAGPVRRVSIIGPGLDFVDKEQGYDFYPPQTIQPFAIIDSLVRLGLADAETIQVVTFDVSTRVNSHIEGIARGARAGTPYVLHLPLAGDVAWTPAMLDYVNRFGGTIGRPVPVTIPPGIGPVRLRALSVRPPVGVRITPVDMNITAQTMTLTDAERFDVIIGTNVFVYYDRPQQGLAMMSAANMLRPGGLLLSNNALVEVPAAGMRSVGYSKILYSNREEDGDLIIWYQKGPK